MKIKAEVGSAAHDPEKLIVPGVVWASKELDGYWSCCLRFGWWHWFAGVTLVLKARGDE